MPSERVTRAAQPQNDIHGDHPPAAAYFAYPAAMFAAPLFGYWHGSSCITPHAPEPCVLYTFAPPDSVSMTSSAVHGSQSYWVTTGHHCVTLALYAPHWPW